MTSAMSPKSSEANSRKKQVVVFQSLSCILCDPAACSMHARLLCPPLSPRVCSDACALSQRCHPTIASSSASSSSYLQPSPASGSFPTSQLFQAWGLIFRCHIFVLFHTGYGTLVVRILEWIALPLSSGPWFVHSLHYDPSILVALHPRHNEAVIHQGDGLKGHSSSSRVLGADS